MITKTNIHKLRCGFRTAILPSIALVFAAAGCSRGDRFTDTPDGKPVRVDFTAGIHSSTRTTSDGNSWVADDKVGIFMLATGGSLTVPAELLADNKKYTIADASSGTLLPADGIHIYYPMDGLVDFAAYYPYRDALADDPYTYKVSVVDQGSPEKLDVLYASSSNQSKDSQSVPLTFRHAMSKVTLAVSAGTGITAADISDLAASAVLFVGMPVSASMALQDGALTTDTDLTKTVNPLKNATPPTGSDASFTAILVPQAAGSYTDRTVVFTIGDQSYTWTVGADEEFAAGTHYTYPVTIAKTGVTVGSPDILDWIPTENTNGSGLGEIPLFMPESNSYILEPWSTPILIPVSRANTAADPTYNLGADATGLGGVQAGNFTAELVWSDLPVGIGGVITEMFPWDDYVYVRPGVAGNAVICIRDRDSGTIKWSWHIWVTEPVGSDLDDRLGIRWMDRALGAKSNTPWVSGVFNNEQWKKTLGLFYQWGRKDAFPGSDGENNNQTYYTPAKPSGTTDNPPTGSFTRMYMMTQNPHIFASNVNTYYGSLYVIGEDNKSWNNDGFKTIYDPCPVGWMVPPHKKSHSTGTDFVWGYGFKIIQNNLSWTFANDYFLTNKGAIFNGVYNATTLNNQFYPMVGGRTDKGEINSAEFQLSCWWSSKPDNARSIHLHIEANSVHANHPTERNSGFSIRCISE